MKVQPKQILVALDYDSFNQAERICNLLNPDKFRIKVGKQLFSAEGPKILEKIHKLGFEIFLDLKIHDIPNTVYKSLLNIFNLNVWMTNIHLLGGQEMIQAAKQAQTESKSNSILVGVTILTSLNDDHLKEVGFQDGVKTIVSKLSSLAKEALLDGVVCSVEEVKNLKKTLGDNFLTVTPGIRVEAKKGDQNRVATIETALENKTDFIVLGREITHAKDSSKMINKIESYII